MTQRPRHPNERLRHPIERLGHPIKRLRRYLQFTLLCWFTGVHCGITAMAETHPTVHPLKPVASCTSPEVWGVARYTGRATDGIEYHVQAFSQPPRLARVIATPGPVALCGVMGTALIFVVPDHGVFQVDRQIDSDAAPFWLAPVSDHFSPASRFVQVDSNLTLVTGHFTTVIETEDEVRNDVVPELRPTMEVSLPVAIEPPLVLDNRQIIWPAGDRFYRFDSESLLPAAAPALRIRQGQLLEVLGDQQHVVPTGLKVQGYCASGEELVVFDATGQVLRMRLEPTRPGYEVLGRFQLDSAVQACQIDDQRQRLYVVNQSPVLWVFNLASASLTAPRAVTSDLIVNSLTGIALYGSDYVISQSTGDSALLVFATEHMVLHKRFRISADVARGMDGVSRSGGLAAMTTPVANLPEGALFVHDAINRLPEAPANLKVIDWRVIAP